MESLLSQLSLLANEALNDKNFDPSRIEQLLALFEYEARNSLSTVEAEHQKTAEEAEAEMKEAEAYLNSQLDDATDEFHRSCEEVERSSEMGRVIGSGVGRASDKYMDAALASAMASMKSAVDGAKLSKVHPN
ncbi:uncharacterized protein A4U43_C08F29440 [Asparagus officinalis]|uniref:uncharacterized protein LOC109851339 n=1 Tax=Asparagus officinalis TaxID=4686 RepID=UPI00098DF218|nr:uncharacterized protein LOC109851339 [Asparagus officinalis]ONK61393.1 uncharacterized protein A4U43_C08F29440 [Asparagus officinalis]